MQIAPHALMDSDTLRDELQETGDEIQLLIERSIQQGADIRKLKKELNNLEEAIPSESQSATASN